MNQTVSVEPKPALRGAGDNSNHWDGEVIGLMVIVILIVFTASLFDK